MALSLDLVDRIHTRLLARYGVAWLRKYPGIEVDVVKADWAEVLAGYANNARALRHGLSHLPDDAPPNAAEFARLCRGAPVFQQRQLPAPAANPAKRAEVLAAVHKAFDGGHGSERQRTLQRIAERRAAGLPLTQFHREVEREMLAQVELREVKTIP